MRKIVVGFIGVIALTSASYGYTFQIKDGIQLVPSVVAVEDMSPFKNTCVDYIIAERSGTTQPKLYTANGVNYNYNGPALTALESGTNLIVKATGNCTVEVAGLITHKGLKYGIITSPVTGRIWLDRNLGATAACTRPDQTTNSACVGGFYQFGRDTDGHEFGESSYTKNKKTGISNQDNEFVWDSIDWTTADAGGSQRALKWSKTDGTSVCPVGFRVPTRQELSEEGAPHKYGGDTIDIGFFLNFPIGGYRDEWTGRLEKVFTRYSVWTTTIAGSNNANALDFTLNSRPMNFNSTFFSHGAYVRCIKN